MDQQDQTPDPNSPIPPPPPSNHDTKALLPAAAAEPVRTRWTPKPEQILILESIFNSGMVNPPKDETVKIRKLLEKFGSVGDANVFYWFQNRRSRSRRRLRLMQDLQHNTSTATTTATAAGAQQQSGGGGGAILYEQQQSLHGGSPSSTCTSSSNSSSGGGGFVSFCTTAAATATDASAASECFSIGRDDCGGGGGGDDLFSISRQMGFTDIERTPILPPPDICYQQPATGFITVFINGVPLEVPRGPIDLRATFGHDVVLVHSSGQMVPVDDFGVPFQGLHMGESYFLVCRPS